MARRLPSVRNGPPDIPSNPRRLTTDPCNKVPRVAGGDGEAAARPERAAGVEPGQIGRLALNRVEPGIWVERQCDLILRHEPACWFGEKGAIEKAVKPYLTYRMSERRAYCRLE